ncbi:unnamed protein product [Rhizophagus irregularis]|nr:unnamed protein product [Rhizophagus irregularis]
MIELEEINNGDYNGADPLTNEEMIQIFEHPDMSNNMPDGLLRRVLFMEIENGNWYTTSHMGRDKLSGMLKEICNITGIDCTNKRIVNHSLRKYTAQKLNDEGLDSQAIMNVTLHRSLAGLNVYRKQNEKQKLTITKLTLPSVSKYVPEILIQQKIQMRKNPMQRKP